MRSFLVPAAVVVGVLAMTGSDEPSEAAMRAAFASTLASEVQSALDFAAESGGEEVLARIRAARTDAFDIRSFTKLDCAPDRRDGGHVCDFAVRIGVATGLLERTLAGRFYAGPQGLMFVNEDVQAGA